MKTKECPSCAMEVDAAAKACSVCNYEFASFSTTKKITALVLIAVFILLLFFI